MMCLLDVCIQKETVGLVLVVSKCQADGGRSMKMCSFA